MSARSLLASVALGLALFAVPFLRYVHFSVGAGGAAAHTDHRPRHGGELRMIGDHHVELRRRGGRIDLYLSDAMRNPIRPETAWLITDERYPMEQRAHHLTAKDPNPGGPIEIELQLQDGTTLRWGRS